MQLLIVESPSKIHTIEKLLGPGYKVVASYGHIRELADDKATFGIDVKNNFKPTYQIMKEKSKAVATMRDACKSASKIFLAADKDPEGEAIAYSCAIVCGLDVASTPRITFTEITKTALTNAIANPRTVDMDIVHSQQARQILDKLLGYELSPVLWRHISSGLNLSAGRVQSVVVKLVADREDEIDKFKQKDFWDVTGAFGSPGVKDFSLPATLDKSLATKDEATALLTKCQLTTTTFKVDTITEKEEVRNPSPPFTTSTLQVEAHSRLGLASKLTMSAAQKLYEAGKITYMRTDSTLMSLTAQKDIADFIVKKWSADYLLSREWADKKKANVKGAHECIRVTNVKETSLPDKDFTPPEKKLYHIIWQRTVASQMKPQRVLVTTPNIGIYLTPIVKHDKSFTAKFEKCLFLGFKIVYQSPIVEKDTAPIIAATAAVAGATAVAVIADDETQDKISAVDNPVLAMIKIGMILFYTEIIATQKFTKPSARYTEASLVSKLEAIGIGRPSTWASMVSKIQEKEYVIKENIPATKCDAVVMTLIPKSKAIKESVTAVTVGAQKNVLKPTSVGIQITSFLNNSFNEIMDYSFTAGMESKLDEIADGTKKWIDVVDSYYQSFHPTVTELMKETKSQDNSKNLLGQHPQSGQNVYALVSKYGPCLQIGSDKSIATYVSLEKNVDIRKLTAAHLPTLLAYPKDLGVYDGLSVTIKKGPYGYYLIHGGKNYTVPKDTAPDTVTLSVATQIIKDKAAGPQNLLAEFKDGNNTIQVLNGKFGPYIRNGTDNISIKVESDAIPNLTLTDIKDLIEKWKTKPKITFKKTTTGAKTGAKTTGAKAKVAKK